MDEMDDMHKFILEGVQVPLVSLQRLTKMALLQIETILERLLGDLLLQMQMGAYGKQILYPTVLYEELMHDIFL